MHRLKEIVMDKNTLAGVPPHVTPHRVCAMRATGYREVHVLSTAAGVSCALQSSSRSPRSCDDVNALLSSDDFVAKRIQVMLRSIIVGAFLLSTIQTGPQLLAATLPAAQNPAEAMDKPGSSLPVPGTTRPGAVRKAPHHVRAARVSAPGVASAMDKPGSNSANGPLPPAAHIPLGAPVRAVAPGANSAIDKPGAAAPASPRTP
jgi:hypothetical protein